MSKCKFCENIFNTESQLRMHIKTIHHEAVVKCREFLKGKCDFSSTECLFKHEDIDFIFEAENISTSQTNDTVHNSFFQNVPTKNHPPDIFIRMMNMMENLAQKVQMMEKILQTKN